MAQIPEVVIIDIIADQLSFTTRTNGDIIKINGLNLTQNQAATLAWLLNQDATLEIRVRIKP